MKPDPTPLRLRIYGGPMPHDTHIVDAATGRELSGVVALTIRSDASSQSPAKCTLELVNVDFDLECKATAHRFGLPPRPVWLLQPFYLRPQPWWANAAGAGLIWAVVGAVAWAAAR